jgi:hypothetical protein
MAGSVVDPHWSQLMRIQIRIRIKVKIHEISRLKTEP